MLGCARGSIAVSLEQSRSFGSLLKRHRLAAGLSQEELRDWLAEGDVTHVAMEATGVYWKPRALF